MIKFPLHAVIVLAAIVLLVACAPYCEASSVQADKASEQKESAPVIEKASPMQKPVPRPPRSNLEEEALPATDVNESIPLLAYPAGAETSIGKMQKYTLGEEDTLLDVARYFRLGFIETRAANPDVDPWTPVPGEEIVIPSFRLLPRTEQKGIVVNLAQMRMYYFSGEKKDPVTFPIGIGREGLETPVGETTVIRKAAGPMWYPTERMREEKPFLPPAVPAGPSNPLGTHALYLGWPTFLIHGSNKPWAIGRRVSSGCMRMYPEDIIDVFNMVPVGTKVTVVDQPILVAMVNGELYLEANPSETQGNDIEIDGDHAIKELDEALKKVIVDAAGVKADTIDWNIVKKAIEERRGYPIPISNVKKLPSAPEKKKPVSAPNE